MKGRWGVAVLLVMVLSIVPVGRLAAEEPTGFDMPLPTVESGEISLAQLRGKVVMVNFWATWCPPCLEEIPTLVKIQEQYKDQGFIILGVTYMDRADRDTLVKFIRRMEINYPIVYGDPLKIQKLASLLGGVMGLPNTKFLDRKGTVVRSHTGGLQVPLLRNLLEPLLDPPS
ncbi:MAG: TlpA family protein disulfide reductase [Magnetococcales bacterium]|nr:TlpA family protein disulfide reductase [Magnetococcales bacterium]